MTGVPYKERVISMSQERKEFITLEDGFFYYWPEGSKHGALSATDLRILADELDRRNAPLQAELEAFFESTQVG